LTNERISFIIGYRKTEKTPTVRQSGGRPKEVNRVDEEEKMAEKAKKALHGCIDQLDIPNDFEIQTIRISVVLKRKKNLQGAEKPKE